MDYLVKARTEWDRADRLKAEGEQKAAQANEHYWKAAEAMATAAEQGTTLATIARAVGRDQRRVAEIVKTSQNFPPASRYSGRGFWEHLDLATNPALAPEILRRAKKDPDRSLKTIRYELNAEKKAAKPEAIKALPKAQKAEIVKTLVADSDVLDAAITDKATRVRVQRATYDMGRQEHREQNQDDPFKPVTDTIKATKELESVKWSLERFVKEMTSAHPSEKAKRDALRLLDEIVELLDILRSIFRSEGTEAELNKILERG